MCFSSRRLLRRFTSGCHGLPVDTSRLDDNIFNEHLDRIVWFVGLHSKWRNICLTARRIAPHELVMPGFVGVLLIAGKQEREGLQYISYFDYE